ncbi:unnamed protein product [Amoebophrya sp. A120]|nr:unnamed protein product [Amoebophrya sp. A120]|eukprot:GSA120T00006690001.1
MSAARSPIVGPAATGGIASSSIPKMLLQQPMKQLSLQHNPTQSGAVGGSCSTSVRLSAVETINQVRANHSAPSIGIEAASSESMALHSSASASARAALRTVPTPLRFFSTATASHQTSGCSTPAAARVGVVSLTTTPVSFQARNNTLAVAAAPVGSPEETDNLVHLSLDCKTPSFSGGLPSQLSDPLVVQEDDRKMMAARLEEPIGTTTEPTGARPATLFATSSTPSCSSFSGSRHQCAEDAGVSATAASGHQTSTAAPLFCPPTFVRRGSPEPRKSIDPARGATLRTTSSQLHPQDQVVRGIGDHVVTTPAGGPGPPVLRRTLTFDGAGFSQETISPQPHNATVGKSSSAIELNTRTLMPRRSPGGTPTAILNLRRPASFKKPTTAVEQQGAFSVGNELGRRRVADLQHYQDEAQEGVLDEDVQQGSREHRQESAGQVDEDKDYRHQLRPRPEVLGSCFNYDASDRIFSPMDVAGDLASPVDHERVRKSKNLWSGVAAQGIERAKFPDHHTQHLRCPPGQATNRPPLGLSPPTSSAHRNNWHQLARESKWIPPEQGREMEARLKILIEKIEQQQETTRALLTEKLCREAELLHLQQRLQSGLPSPAGNGGTSTSGTSAAPLAPFSRHAVGDTATQKRSSTNYGLGMPPTAPGAAGGTKPSLRSLTGGSGGTAPQGSSAPPGSSSGRRRILKKPCNAANASTASSSKTRLLPDCQRMTATHVQDPDSVSPTTFLDCTSKSVADPVSVSVARSSWNRKSNSTTNTNPRSSSSKKTSICSPAPSPDTVFSKSSGSCMSLSVLGSPSPVCSDGAATSCVAPEEQPISTWPLPPGGVASGDLEDPGRTAPVADRSWAQSEAFISSISPDLMLTNKRNTTAASFSRRDKMNIKGRSATSTSTRRTHKDKEDRSERTDADLHRRVDVVETSSRPRTSQQLPESMSPADFDPCGLVDWGTTQNRLSISKPPHSIANDHALARSSARPSRPIPTQHSSTVVLQRQQKQHVNSACLAIEAGEKTSTFKSFSQSLLDEMDDAAMLRESTDEVEQAAPGPECERSSGRNETQNLHQILPGPDVAKCAGAVDDERQQIIKTTKSTRASSSSKFLQRDHLQPVTCSPFADDANQGSEFASVLVASPKLVTSPAPAPHQEHLHDYRYRGSYDHSERGGPLYFSRSSLSKTGTSTTRGVGTGTLSGNSAGAKRDSGTVLQVAASPSILKPRVMLPVAPGGSRAASNAAGNSKRGVRRPSTSSGTASAALPRPSIHQALHHFRRTSTLLSPPYGTSSSGLDNEPHTAPSRGGIVDRANASFFEAAPHLLAHQQRQRAPDPVTIVRRSHDGVQRGLTTSRSTASVFFNGLHDTRRERPPTSSGVSGGAAPPGDVNRRHGPWEPERRGLESRCVAASRTSSTGSQYNNSFQPPKRRASSTQKLSASTSCLSRDHHVAAPRAPAVSRQSMTMTLARTRASSSSGNRVEKAHENRSGPCSSIMSVLRDDLLSHDAQQIQENGDQLVACDHAGRAFTSLPDCAQSLSPEIEIPEVSAFATADELLQQKGQPQLRLAGRKERGANPYLLGLSLSPSGSAVHTARWH